MKQINKLYLYDPYIYRDFFFVKLYIIEFSGVKLTVTFDLILVEYVLSFFPFFLALTLN